MQLKKQRLLILGFQDISQIRKCSRVIFGQSPKRSRGKKNFENFQLIEEKKLFLEKMDLRKKSSKLHSNHENKIVLENLYFSFSQRVIDC